MKQKEQRTRCINTSTLTIYYLNDTCVANKSAKSVVKITYSITLTSATEMKKPVSKCKVKSGNVRLNDDEPYSTFSAQLLVVITSTLKPRLEGLHQYKICCIISNILPKPGMLISSEEDYTIMVATALKSKGPHIINITVEELDEDDGVDKENEESQSGEWGKKGSKKKVCICRYLMTSFS